MERRWKKNYSENTAKYSYGCELRGNDGNGYGDGDGGQQQY